MSSFNVPEELSSSLSDCDSFSNLLATDVDNSLCCDLRRLFLTSIFVEGDDDDDDSDDRCRNPR